MANVNPAEARGVGFFLVYNGREDSRFVAIGGKVLEEKQCAETTC